jgi:hypothetical protein
VLNVDTKELKRIPLPQLSMIAGFPRHQWTADGRSLLFSGGDEEFLNTLYALRVDSGAATAVFTAAQRPRAAAPNLNADAVMMAAWSPDGQTVYTQTNHRSTTRQVSLSERRVRGGAAREIYRSAEPAGITWVAASPDGKTLAFALNRFGPPFKATLELLSLVEGTVRTIAPIERTGISGSWTPDGTAVIVARRQPGTDVNMPIADAWVYPVTGGEPRKTDLAWAGLGNVVVHPDGKRVAFTGASPDRATEIWLLENFLPPAKAPTPGAATAKK